MSDLQARLAKLRATNQSLKAITERIDSAKVLAVNVVAELDEVIEALPEVAPPIISAAQETAPISTPVFPIETSTVETTSDLDAVIETHSESEPETKPVFVKDTAPQVAGVLPEMVELAEEEEPPVHSNEDLHANLQSKVRREGSN